MGEMLHSSSGSMSHRWSAEIMQHAYVKAMANSRWCLYERAHVDVRVNRRFIFNFFLKDSIIWLMELFSFKRKRGFRLITVSVVTDATLTSLHLHYVTSERGCWNVVQMSRRSTARYERQRGCTLQIQAHLCSSMASAEIMTQNRLAMDVNTYCTVISAFSHQLAMFGSWMNRV